MPIQTINEQEHKKTKTLMKFFLDLCKKDLEFDTFAEVFYYFSKSINSNSYYGVSQQHERALNIANLTGGKKLTVAFIKETKNLISLESIVDYFEKDNNWVLRIGKANLLEIIQFLKDHYALNDEQQADLDNLLFYPVYLISFCWYEAVTNHKRIGDGDHTEKLYKPEFLKYTNFSKPDNQDKKIEESTDTYQSPPPVFEGEVVDMPEQETYNKTIYNNFNAPIFNQQGANSKMIFCENYVDVD